MRCGDTVPAPTTAPTAQPLPGPTAGPIIQPTPLPTTDPIIQPTTHPAPAPGAIFSAYNQSWSDKWTASAASHALAGLPSYVTHVILSFMRPDCGSYPGGLSFEVGPRAQAAPARPALS